MSSLDTLIIVVYLALIFGIGLFCSRGQKSLRDYFLGDRNIPWWAAACSGVGAIVSGVAYLGAPGLAFTRDYSYHQIRFGIPLAMLIICVVMLPIFFRLNIYSIYEYLERRFDRRVRLLASAIFFFTKFAYLAVVIYAPSLVVAQATGLPVQAVVLATGIGTMIYTLVGGIRAVIWTDTLQVGILLSGIAVTIWMVLGRVPGGLDQIIQTADAAGRLKFVDWSFSLTETYTVWGGLIGGTFLLISQFGSNQAEIQRFLTTKSIRHANLAMGSSMLMATVVGISLFFIGTTLFGFYTAFPDKGGLTIDPNRIFAKFIIEEMPVGMRGLLIAAVLSASMSAISVVLNSLATVVITDFAPLWRREASTIGGARWMTLFVGVGVTMLACFADRFGNMLEASTRIISLFIGSVTGIFLLGMLSRRVNARSGFYGMIAGMVAAFVINFGTDVSFLWLSPISGMITIGTGIIWSGLSKEVTPEVVKELSYSPSRKS